jgi:hypothetical protein
MIDPITTAKIFSQLGNSSSLLPIAVKDMAHSSGMTTVSYVTGKEVEGKDRFIDEFGTQAIWIGGIPFYKKIIDLTLYKIAKYNPKVDIRLLKDENIVKKAIQYAPSEKIAKDIEKAAKNSKFFKNLNMAKFLISTALTLISYSLLTSFRHKHTEKNIINEIHQEEQIKKAKDKKLSEEYFKAKTSPAFKAIKNDTKSLKPSFGMNLTGVKEFMFDPVKNMMIVDAGITAERFSEARNPQDIMVYAIKEGSFWAFMYFVGKNIQKKFEIKSEEKYNKSIDLDIMAIKSDSLKAAFKDKNVYADVNKFNKMKNPEDIYKFLCTEKDNLVVKMAKASKIIKIDKSTQKVDTQHYIDLDAVKGVAKKLEKLYSQYTTSGEELEAFLSKVTQLKKMSILKNIGISMGVLGLVVPGAVLASRLLNKDNKEFMVKKQIHEKLKQTDFKA